MKREGTRRTRILAMAVGLAALAVTTMAAASRVTLSALEEPGPFEMWAATRAKHWLVGRAARSLALEDDEIGALVAYVRSLAPR